MGSAVTKRSNRFDVMLACTPSAIKNSVYFYFSPFFWFLIVIFEK